MQNLTTLLSRADCERLLGIDDAVTTVRDVFRAHGHGQVAMPAKISLDLRPHGLNAWHNAMPAYIAPMGAAGIKWAGGYGDNPKQHGLPYVMAVVVLQDPASGYPLAIMDGAHITAIRTGAVAAVCAEMYGSVGDRPVALIGAGEQAGTFLQALMLTRPPTHVLVYDIAADRAESFAAASRERHDIHVRPTATVEEAVRGAGVVLTATPADEPLVKSVWLDPGTTSISLGSFQEFDDDAVLDSDKIFVDSWAQCEHRGELKRFAESGRLSRADICAEVGETAAGVAPGRENEDERILIVPIGLGSHDVALAKLAWDRSDKSGPSFDFLAASTLSEPPTAPGAGG